MRSLEYTHEKLFATVLILAEGGGTVQQRLADAYESQLMLLTADDLPFDMRDAFIEIESRLIARDPIGDEGRVQATMAVMDEFEARSIIEAIVAMYGEISRRMG